VVEQEPEIEKPVVVTPSEPVMQVEVKPDEPELNVIETEIEESEDIQLKPFDPTLELPHYHFPSIDLLNDVPVRTDLVDDNEMEENKARITETLNSYKIAISHIDATVGPTVTLYEIIPAEGIRIAQIKKLEDDIALSLAALGIRIIAPIPGKGTIGIEVPNKEPQMVPIRSVITSKQFQECKYELPMALGATISKDIFIADLAKVPHLLVAGATGQGKSVGLNTIIASLLYKKHPAELKFVLIDPKTVEFKLYSKLEHHYLAKLPGEADPIITDPMKVVATLNSLCQEMEDRFAMFNRAETRDIKEYNQKFVARKLNPEKGHRYLPYIVVIVDEFADLTMVAGKEVERPIARLAQKARAAGIHIILATQRPSTDVITGMIKANFPGRVAFRVMQMVDSRTILDRPGANQLIGKGDMLISLTGEVTRVQCAFISTEEVVNICRAIDDQMGYSEAYPLPEPMTESDGGGIGNMANVNDLDPLFEEAARFIIESGTASTSSLQRRYQIGYNRAGRIMDQLEARGVVGPASGAKPRSVLIDSLQLERICEANGIN
jgi:S-DNA-T family DNA segregation ATPase FtsK/SpoIIIE